MCIEQSRVIGNDAEGKQPTQVWESVGSSELRNIW